MKRKWLWTAFGAYCALMLWLLFGQRMGALEFDDYVQQLQQNINLLPLDTVRRYLWVLRYSDQPGMRTHAIINLVGNVVMFVPMGVLLPLLWERLRKFWAFFLSTVGIIAAVEVVQLVTLLGKSDVDDLLLNVIGALLGWCICLLVTKWRKN